MREVECGPRLVHGGHRGDEIVLRLNVVGGLDHEQRLALDHAVAGPGEKPGDPDGIGREHRRRAVLVDGDLAFGDVFDAETPFRDGLNGQAGPFGRARCVAAQTLAGLARPSRMPALWAADLGIAPSSRAAERQQADGHGQPLPGNDLQSLGNLVKHPARNHSATICPIPALIVPNSRSNNMKNENSLSGWD